MPTATICAAAAARSPTSAPFRRAAAAHGLLFAAALAAQAPGDPWAATHDAGVPTPEQVLGHAIGAELSLHAEIEHYLQALAAQSDRVRLVEYGRSWEGRRLWYAVVARPDRLAGLDALKASWRELADPRALTLQRAEQLVAELPAVGWLAYCVHGDEPSGSDAALAVLWHLASARGDELVDSILANCVVVVDPLQNPDGHDRFVHTTRAARGLEAASEPLAAEHTQPWPGGRVNHYLFDMNRDWFAMTQPETRARIAAFLDWRPHLYVDLHEMGGNSTYYFAPPASPLNPEITPVQRQWLERYGRNNARWFDHYGIDYFTREEYDSFYPGYGEGWPTFQGTVGMTFEQGSSRGLVFRRRDETLLGYADCVQHHFLASLATLQTLALGRREVLSAFVDYRRSAIAEGRSGPVAAYVFPPARDAARLGRLMELLMAQGIEVRRADAEFTAAAALPMPGTGTATGAGAGAGAGGAGEPPGPGEPKAGEPPPAPTPPAATAPTPSAPTPGPHTFPAGTFVVDLAQPQKRLASVLLARHFDMDEQFLGEQRSKERRREGTDFYDLTAWSLPLLFGVETWTADAAPAARLLSAGDAVPVPAPLAPRAPRVGYVVPWANGGAALLCDLLRQGVSARVLDKPFAMGGVSHAAGTFVVRTNGNPADLPTRMAEAARRAGVEVTAVEDSWVDSGINFGSNHSHVVRPPRVAIAWDRPVNANSAGWARFLLERRYGVPVTPVRVPDLANLELDRYTALILPDGGDYGRVLGKDGGARIAAWVQRGGVVIALAGAVRWLSSPGVELLASKPEDRGVHGEPKRGGAVPNPTKPDGATGAAPVAVGEKPADKKDDKDAERPFDYEKAILPDSEPPPRAAGAILGVDLDREHWLAFGYDGNANVVLESSDVFTPVKLDRGTNVGIYAPADRLVRAGFLWDELLKQLPRKAWLVHQAHGKGHVVAFASDPNLRAFADGLNLLFVNAVVLTPGR